MYLQAAELRSSRANSVWFEAAVDPLAGDGSDHFLEAAVVRLAGGHQFHLPTLLFGVAQLKEVTTSCLKMLRTHSYLILLLLP